MRAPSSSYLSLQFTCSHHSNTPSSRKDSGDGVSPPADHGDTTPALEGVTGLLSCSTPAQGTVEIGHWRSRRCINTKTACKRGSLKGCTSLYACHAFASTSKPLSRSHANSSERYCRQLTSRAHDVSSSSSGRVMTSTDACSSYALAFTYSNRSLHPSRI